MLVGKRNQYLGINAHTNSWILDREGEWGSFHARHIVDIAQKLDEVLPEGYEARPERSLQVEIVHFQSGEMSESDLPQRERLYPQPDVSIYQIGATQGSVSEQSKASTPTLIAPLLDTLDIQDEEELTAIVIYKVDGSGDVGKPVTRIELLSPTNKRPGKGYEQYRLKRNAALASQIPLIEIDYVHERRPIVDLLAGYPSVPNTHPYHVIVTDPHPSLRDGITSIYSFDVDAPIPTFGIPLDHGAVSLDLNTVYHTTFKTTRTLQRVADYSQTPVQLGKYSPEDQRRIQQRMAMVAALEHTGHDLNSEGPFPLDEALMASRR